MFELYLITPEIAPERIAAQATAALAAAPPGRVALQLRARELADPDLRALASALRAVTRARGAPLLISSALELAREVGADGVQLPERGPSIAEARSRLGPAALLGASRHDAAGVRAAARDGASFVTLSPLHAVPDKGEPLGLPRFAAIARTSALPVLALGGINPARAELAIAAGAHGVAVIRDVFESDDPQRAVALLLAAIDAGRSARR
jgi:thiamine-phosphate diphosphorylase